MQIPRFARDDSSGGLVICHETVGRFRLGCATGRLRAEGRKSGLKDIIRTMICRLAVALFCMSGLASACTCVEISQDAARSAAYAIFEGTVTEIHHFEAEGPKRPYTQARITFKIAQSWKGPSGSSLQVYIWGPAACGGSYEFGLGRRYIVYADQYPAETKSLALGIEACAPRIRRDTAFEARLLGKSREGSK
jgi:hypothetical protein